MEILYVFTAIMLALFPSATASAASVACLALKNVVVRTLFPMMVLSRLIAYSPLFERLSIFIAKSRLWRRLGLSERLIPAVLSGLMSGLPTSARETEALLVNKRITDVEAKKAVALSSLPSPAFVILVASDGLLKGIFRYVLLLLTAFSVVSLFPSERTEGGGGCIRMTFPQAMSSSVLSAISVSANIVFFSTVTCLVSRLIPGSQRLAAVFFEMGSGIIFAQGKGLLQAAAVGWCGVSALSQIRAEAPHVSPRLYLITRVTSVAVLIIFEILVKNIKFFQNIL